MLTFKKHNRFLKFIFSILVIVMILFTCRVIVEAATRYYVNSSGGSDINDGLSEVYAWKTINKVNGTSFSPGDTILFKRGEIWREQLIPHSGDITGYITYGAYGTGNTPIINGSDLVTTWGDEGGNVWSATLTTEPSQAFFDDIEGTQESAQGNLNAAREWYWDANVLYVYSTSDPDTAYSDLL